MSLGEQHSPRHPQGNLGPEGHSAHWALWATRGSSSQLPRGIYLSCSLDVEPGVGGRGGSPPALPQRGECSWTWAAVTNLLFCSKVRPLQPPLGERIPRAPGGVDCWQEGPLSHTRPGGWLEGASSTTRPLVFPELEHRDLEGTHRERLSLWLQNLKPGHRLTRSGNPRLHRSLRRRQWERGTTQRQSANLRVLLHAGTQVQLPTNRKVRRGRLRSASRKGSGLLLKI